MSETIDYAELRNLDIPEFELSVLVNPDPEPGEGDFWHPRPKFKRDCPREVAERQTRDLNAIRRLLPALLDERDQLLKELELWRPLTPEEAEAELAKAEAVPLSEERLAQILAAATDPASRLPNDEQAQLAAELKRLRAEIKSLTALMDINARLR